MKQNILRPNFTKNIHQLYIQKGKSLNIFGAKGVGKSRFIEDLKSLIDSDTNFVSLNMRELRTNYKKFTQKLKKELDIGGEADTIELVLAEFAKKSGKKVLLIDHFEYLFEANHDRAFNFDFFEQLNSFKNNDSVSLLILSTHNYKHEQFYKDGELTTSPLDISVEEITPLLQKEIEDELKKIIDIQLQEKYNKIRENTKFPEFPKFQFEFLDNEIIYIESMIQKEFQKKIGLIREVNKIKQKTEKLRREVEKFKGKEKKEIIKEINKFQLEQEKNRNQLNKQIQNLSSIIVDKSNPYYIIVKNITFTWSEKYKIHIELKDDKNNHLDFQLGHIRYCMVMDEETKKYFNILNKIEKYIHIIKNISEYIKKDSIEFSIFVPTRILLNDNIIVNVWAYLPKQYEKITEIIDRTSFSSQQNIATAFDLNVRRDSLLTLKLEIQNLNIEESIKTIEWNGTPQNTMFSVSIPSKLDNRNCLGRLIISYQGILVSAISFNIIIDKIRDKKEQYFSIPIKNIFTPRTAFASYSSKDKKKVLSRIQGMKKILPNLDIFIDLISLRSGELWEEKLYEHVPNKDIFYLFWSKSASESEWVEKEWRLALEKKGLSYISPIPLEEPKYAPPPKELSSLHFSDMYLPYLK